MLALLPLEKKQERVPLPLCLMRIQEVCLIQLWWPPELRLPTSRTVRSIFLFLISYSLWYFVIAAQMVKGTPGNRIGISHVTLLLFKTKTKIKKTTWFFPGKSN